MKRCPVCRRMKSLHEFPKSQAAKDGRHSYCLECNRERVREYYIKHPDKLKAVARKNYSRHSEARKRTNKEYRKNNPDIMRDQQFRRSYGITLAEYDAILQQQGGRCAICKAVPQNNLMTRRNHTRLHVDHDHVTGKVRGLLCGSCNVALGHLHESVEILNAMIKYLEGGDNRLNAVA